MNREASRKAWEQGDRRQRLEASKMRYNMENDETGRLPTPLIILYIISIVGMTLTIGALLVNTLTTSKILVHLHQMEQVQQRLPDQPH